MKFISNLYTYLVQQIRCTLEATVNQYKDKIHEDLIEDLISAMKGEHERRKMTFREEKNIQIERLATEYENICDFPKAEFYYKKLILRDPNNIKKLMNMARFSMKQNMVDRAYEFFRRAKELDPNNQDLILAFSGILIERKRYTEAKHVLKEILDKDFKHCHANIIYSLI